MASNECCAQKVSGIGLIKNARSGSLTFVKSRDFQGRIGAIPYPQEIPGGQWAEFVHSGYVGSPRESIGTVVYRCTNPDGKQCDWMMSWLNICGTRGETSRKVYTEIKAVGHYDNDTVWQEILKWLNGGTNHSEAKCENCKATLDVVPDDACDAFAIFQGIIQAN